MRAIGAAARSAAAQVREAVARGAAAVAEADAAAADWPILPTGWLLAPEAARRREVLVAVNTALDAALSTISTAASTLLAAVAVDPRDPARALSGPPAAAGSVGQLGSTGPARSAGLGFPARTDRVNRAALAADRSSGDPYRMSFADAVERSLQHAGAGGLPVQLLVYDPAAFGGQGRVAIGVGDLATADNIAVLTPGISNSPMAMAATLDAATALQAEASRQDPRARTAVVTWFGYDIPLSWPLDRPAGSGPMLADTVAVLNADRAAQGGDLLATDLRAFAAMAPASALVTLVGHSMGSAATSEAAGRHPVRADNLVLTGSPGAGSGRRDRRRLPVRHPGARVRGGLRRGSDHPAAGRPRRLRPRCGDRNPRALPPFRSGSGRGRLRCAGGGQCGDRGPRWPDRHQPDTAS